MMIHLTNGQNHERRNIILMLEITLKRTDQNNKRTMGELFVNGEKFSDTLELPWKDNEIGKSCVPPGRYPLKVRSSKRFPISLILENTSPREFILIHPANDVSELRGCIALGDRNGSQVWSSTPKTRALVALIRRNEGVLVIEGKKEKKKKEEVKELA